MRPTRGTFALLLILPFAPFASALADTHCYGFRNDSSEVVTLSFAYHPSTGNVITGAALEPGKAYPFDGRPWCWNLPEDTTAIVTVAGPGAPQWKGTLVLGNRSGTAPSGTYVVRAATPAAAAPAAAAGAAAGAASASAAGAAAGGAASTASIPAPSKASAATSKAGPAAASTAAGQDACLANSYPDNEAYCLTALETDIQLRCSAGHTGISGTIVVSHLTVQCRSGRKVKLTCGTATGGRQKCNLNDQQICTDENVRNAGDYCAR
jgi:hypothetical protein